jgi:hypothetical protein
MQISQAEFQSLPFGWMEISDCQALASYLQGHSFSRILEIGSFCGRSTRLLTDYSTTNSTIVSVDYWNMDVYSQFPAPQKMIDDNNILDVYSNFKLNCPMVQSIRGSILDSQTQAQIAAVSPFYDLCFIDADRRPDKFFEIFNYAKSVAPHLMGTHYNPRFPEYLSTLKKMNVRRILDSTLWVWTDSL